MLPCNSYLNNSNYKHLLNIISIKENIRILSILSLIDTILMSVAEQFPISVKVHTDPTFCTLSAMVIRNIMGTNISSFSVLMCQKKYKYYTLHQRKNSVASLGNPQSKDTVSVAKILLQFIPPKKLKKNLEIN